MGDNENSSDPEGNSQGGDTQYGELTVSTFWPRVTEEIRKINVVCSFKHKLLNLACNICILMRLLFFSHAISSWTSEIKLCLWLGLRKS